MVTVNKVIETLNEVVAEAGDDFVYEKKIRPNVAGQLQAVCVYVDNGQPDCIAAKVMHKLGVPIETLSGYEGKRPRYFVDDPNFSDWETESLFVLTEAQYEQDAGKTWGFARDAATYYARELGRNRA
jgi:hypothetical protein